MRRSAEGLFLTQDAALWPTLTVDPQLRKNADRIFEKEAMYLRQSANRRAMKRDELYVDDYGCVMLGRG